MPSPSTPATTQRPDLASSFMEWGEANAKEGFVANRVLAPVDVASQAGTFGKIPIEQLLQKRDTKRAPGAGYSRGNFTFTTSTYACEEHGAEEPIDDREREMYRDFFDAEVVASHRAYSAVLRNAEERAANLIFNTSTWSGSDLFTAVVNGWDDAPNATPVTDVASAITKVYGNSGLWANAVVLNMKTFRLLRQCDQVIDRITSAGAGSAAKASDITESMLAQVFDVDQVIVAGQTANSATEGQDPAIGQIWSDDFAMVCRVASSSDFQEPCLGRTFHWSQDGSDIGGTVETYREEAVRSEVVRVRHDVDEMVLYPEAGHLLDITGTA